MQSSGISSPVGSSASRSQHGAPARNRFALTGRSVPVDHRIQAVRRDLADVRLADRIFAPHYAAAMLRAATAQGDVLAGKNSGDAVLSEILPGERFDVLEISGGKAWGVSETDGVVGYIDASLLGVAADAVVATPGDDWVAHAESLVGAPYRSGGRSAAGTDCSGLVFQSLRAAGIAAPRFADLQAQLGEAVAQGAPLQRGDLIVIDGHAMIVTAPDSVVHASGEAGQVVREPLADALARYDGAVPAIRRLA